MSTHNHQLSRRSTLVRGAAGIITPSPSSKAPAGRPSRPGRPDRISAPRHPTSARRASDILAEAENITLDDDEEVIVVSDDEEMDKIGVRRQPGDVIPDREKVNVVELVNEDGRVKRISKAQEWEGKSWLATLKSGSWMKVEKANMVAVKMLSLPGPDTPPRERAEWAQGKAYLNEFGRDHARDRKEHRRLDGPHKRDATWEGMTKVGSAVGNETVYRVDDTVVVRPSRGDEKWTHTIQVADADPKKLAVHPKNSWIANILELRVNAKGERYALVLWLYWPSDLKNAHVGEEYPKDGRKGYHGDYELVVSNHFDITDVRTFDRVFTEGDVRPLLEVDGEVVREYYWRQSYDVRDGSLSELPRYCKCNKFWKPDTILLQCPSNTCAKWMHPECIIGDVTLKKWMHLVYTSGRSTIGRAKTGPRGDRNSAFVDHSRWAHRLSGEMNEDKTKVVVLDKRGSEDPDQWLQEELGIRCFFCAESFVQEVKEE